MIPNLVSSATHNLENILIVCPITGVTEYKTRISSYAQNCNNECPGMSAEELMNKNIQTYVRTRAARG